MSRLTLQHAEGNGNSVMSFFPISERAPAPAGLAVTLSFNTNVSDCNFGLMNTISLEDAKKVMQAKDANGNPAPFAFKTVKFDYDRKTGGEYVTYKHALLCSMTHTHIRVKSPGSSEVRKYRTILITHVNEKEVTI